MDGVAKAALLVGGRSLATRVVGALTGARRLIAVGPRLDAGPVHAWVREVPPGGGPVAALAAGVAEVHAPFVAVVAGDLPFLTPAAMARLGAEADRTTVAIAVDDDGREQYLLAVWPTSALRTALASVGSVHGSAVRAVYRDVAARRVCLDGMPPPWWDCDTPEQLARARAWAGAAGAASPASARVGP